MCDVMSLGCSKKERRIVNFMNKAVALALLLLGSNLWHEPCLATNGLNVIGHGAESIAMGGADLAISRDTSALNLNPAGLTQIGARELDLIGVAVHSDPIRHKDSFGNSVENSKDYFAGGTFGYATRLKTIPMTAGIAVFGQGGAGAQFKHLTTAFGTTDSMENILRLARLNAGAGYVIDEHWSIGGALVLTYADDKEELFPDTSVFTGDPSTSFFGFSVKGLKATGVGAKLGAQYKTGHGVTVGAAYTTPTRLKFKDGHYISNQSSIGAGMVEYRDAKADGIDLPQELGVGIAIQSTPAFLWSAEIDWINWSNAVKKTTLHVKDPDSATPFSSFTFVDHPDWNNQIVYALGLAYSVTDTLTLRAGYNYAKQPVPSQSLSPLLCPIGEQHIGLGLAYHLRKTWRVDFSYLLDRRNSETYTNPNIPFGTNTVAESRAHSYYASLIHTW
jgi:long-chain fatty acid transport protein